VNQLTVIDNNANVEAYRASTNAADICKEIVVATASIIQGRKFVSVEGWQAIAIAHGCTAGARDVECVEGGVRAIGEIRRMSDGAIISTAEGFVGEDEPTWYGGQSRGKTLPKRADYAIRAMAQTRAISRACRSAFAHVVVMMKAGLATTPAEEVPPEGFDRGGDVIDHEATQPHEPAPRTKLDGPHTSKTALRTAVVAIIGKVRAAQSNEEIDKIQKENIATIKQANVDWPALLTGDPNIEEDKGLRGAIEQRRAEIAAEGEYGGVQKLIDSMNDCETLAQLTNWTAANGDEIDALSDADRRKFEAARDVRESGIMEQDKVGA
jgi:hypothetical protein